MMRYLLTLIILYFCTWQIVSAQSEDYFQYKPFDSTGVFKERVIILFDSTTYSISTGRVKGAPTYLDSISLEKLEYLADLLRKNDELVVVILLYDDFHMIENHQVYSANFTYFRAKRVISNALRRGVDPLRVEFNYSSCIQGGHTHEELHSTDRRLEFLVYELPNF